MRRLKDMNFMGVIVEHVVDSYDIINVATTSNMQMHNFSIIQQISSSVGNWHFWKLGTRIWQIEILLILLNTRSTSVESLMCEFDNEKVIRLFMISSSSQQKFQVYTKFSFAFHEIKKNALPSYPHRFKTLFSKGVKKNWVMQSRVCKIAQ